MKVEVAVIGNGVAGYACAAGLARHGVRPLLIGRGLPVDRPPLTKSALVTGEPVLLADAERLAERGIDTLDAMVDHVDLAGLRLVAAVHEVEAQAIVLATGLSYRPPPIPGFDAAHVNATPGGMRRLAAELAGGPKRVAVVGGGFLGVETAATLVARGHEVTVLDLLERPFDKLHDPLPAVAGETLTALGVAFHGAAAVHAVAVEEESGVATISCGDGELTADVVVAATGGRLVAPPGIAADSVLPLVVDESMRVSGYNGVYAVGDVVAVPHARFGRLWFPHWDGAIGTGEQAAAAVAGVAGSYDRLPYWWSDVGPLRLAEVGWADAAVEWRAEDGLHVGRDADGEPVSVLVVDEPRRLREARALILGGS